MTMNQPEITYYMIPSCNQCKNFIEDKAMFQSKCKKFVNIKRDDYELAMIARSRSEKCGIAGKYFSMKNV